jgi:hypothetical protein
MAISEIEKLERRFAENPQGLTFAPLAEAYRKSGDPERALGILRSGLELHPDYIPASIVLGRCHLDLGSDPDAEAAFSHVLSLDPENVIALKAMADVTERGGRFDDAAARLRQLLEVDRSNEEAQAQLDRVLTAKREFDSAERPASVVDESSLVPDSVFAAFGTTIELSAEPEVETVPEAEVDATAEPEPPAAAMPVEPSPEPTPSQVNEPLWTDVPAVVDELAVPTVDSLFGTILPEHAAFVDAFDTEPPVVEPLGIEQVSAPEGLVLEGHERSEYQIPSALDELVVERTESLAAEYQLPDASSELISLEPSSTASEFQSPDASSSLLADLSGEDAAEPAVESASSFAYLLTSDGPPAQEDAPPPGTLILESSVETTGFDGGEATPSEVEEAAPVGEWVTWSDAALDEDALPFEEPVAEQAPEPETVPEPMSVEPVGAVAAVEAVDVVDLVEIVEVVDTIEATPLTEEHEPEPQPELEPDLVVTESMAELFVRQGHAGDALRIYRELADRRPGDARLVARIAELEAVVASSRGAATPYSARVTGGVSVRDLMRSILVARPGGHAAAPPSAPVDAAPRASEPTRPAQDSISLSDVFGEGGAPLPPAYRAPRASAGEPGVSFDEFFDTPPAQHASTVRPRGPRPAADDLDQFHSWLQNLKR